jgi:16S rRNA (guanine(527)-N(7))-methyltransferase RsmG
MTEERTDRGGIVEAVVAAIAREGVVEGALLRERAGKLAGYVELLLEANERINLVSRRSASVEEIVTRHLADSLRGLPHLPPGRPGRLVLVDVGSGGGFPAIPLLVVRPDLQGWLFESTAKKARFLSETAKMLSLTCTVVNARFPDPISMKQIPPIDVLTTRAVADAGRLVRSARPYLARRSTALLWTTRRLLDDAVAESGMHSWAFHGTPGTEQAGIAALERST